VHKELTFGGDEGLSVTRRKKETNKERLDRWTNRQKKEKKKNKNI
jgi:hypothetical protein